jgi:hypothetical protein
MSNADSRGPRCEMPEAVESSDGRISSLRVGMPEDLAKTVLSDFGVGVPSAETKAAFRG